MGDRYNWREKCLACGHMMNCYYAESCDSTDAHCNFCGKEYDIVMEFRLIPKYKKSGK